MKEKKKNNSKNIIIFVLIAIIIVLIAVFMIKGGFNIFKPGDNDTTNPSDNPTNSVSDYVDDYTGDSTPSSSEADSSEDESEKFDDEKDKEDNKESESKNENNSQVYAASLPLTVDDALAILSSRYGKGYAINMSTVENGYNNFAVFKDDERYASISVNLSTGEATERIIETGKQTKFNLL